MKWKKMKIVALWSLLLGACVVLFGFAKSEQANSICWKVEVEVQELEGVYFINEETVQTRIMNMGHPIIGTMMSEIAVNDIQQRLERMPSVSEATVYPSVDGVLSVKVSQRKPVARVIEANGESFYIDDVYEMMPLSDSYTAKVPLVVIQSELTYREKLEEDSKDQVMINDVMKLVNYIAADKFWSAMIEHVVRTEKGEYILIPRLGNQEIILGKTHRLDRKMKKLRAFYDEEMGKRNLNQYKTINLKYKDQVIGERYY
ncbi:MAG: hypothetical protein HRT74_03750 [Flavobacteriales bacterium]|nr:hypothetical protein [Flavobacteriales bacterium]